MAVFLMMYPRSMPFAPVFLKKTGLHTVSRSHSFRNTALISYSYRGVISTEGEAEVELLLLYAPPPASKLWQNTAGQE